MEGCHALAMLSVSRVQGLSDLGAHSSLSLSRRSEACALPEGGPQKQGVEALSATAYDSVWATSQVGEIRREPGLGVPAEGALGLLR